METPGGRDDSEAAALSLVLVVLPAAAAGAPQHLQVNPALLGTSLVCTIKSYQSQAISDVYLRNPTVTPIDAGTKVIISAAGGATIVVPLPQPIAADGEVLLRRQPLVGARCTAHTKGLLPLTMSPD